MKLLRGGLTLALAVTASAALAQVPADPAGSGVIVGAVNWILGVLTGTVATVAATIAIAAIGFMMLTGRINWRHGAVVVLGVFILFGAANIVAGIRAGAGG
jgi:type IV secretion system protein VirB2